MTREELDRLWKDPRNRRWGLIYFCKEDPRLVVPRRFKWMGWTINFAQPAAWPTVLFLIALLVVPAGVAVRLGGTAAEVVATVVASVIVVCLVCIRLSTWPHGPSD